MTDRELEAKFLAITARRRRTEERIVDRCRHLVAALKDAGANSAAKEVAALYFELDAVTGEMTEIVMQGAGRLFEILTRG